MLQTPPPDPSRADPSRADPSRARAGLAFAPRRRPLWRRAAIVALIGALGLGGAYWWNRGREAATAPALQTQRVVRGDIEQQVTALAVVQPKTYVDVGTQVSGLLRKIHVEIGDEVKKDLLLAEIDPTVYQTRVLGDEAQLDNLKAQLAQQNAQLDLDRLRNDRAQKLLASKSGSQDAADATDATVRIGEAKVDALKAQIKQTQATLEGDLANLGYTKIFAPMDGTVVSIDAREGGTLNANMTAPVILRISDLDTMQVKAQVAEADIPKVKVGMEVYFTTLGMPDRRFTAKVVQILPTPETINDVVLYSVLIDVANTERLLMTSMSAQVFFRLGSASDVLVVPVAAARPLARGRSGEDRSLAMVRVMENGAVVEKRVRLGLANRTHVEVREGLKEGDEVVTTADVPRSTLRMPPPGMMR
jgi:macrolide-specific efflux system membrane fusion protein